MEGWYGLAAFVLSFLIAQTYKLITGLLHGRKSDQPYSLKTAIGYFARSGGMPSGHAASFTALSIYLGCTSGFSSGLFILAICMDFVIIYDAIHVRYAVGEQGKALNKLLTQAGKPPLPVIEGHTVSQVIVGVIIGIIVGFVVFWVT